MQLSGRVVVFCKTAKSKRLKLCNTACVRKALGVLLCRSQADHPAASSEHDKRDGQAENLLLCKQCISGSSGRSPERRWPIFASLTIFDMMISSLKMAGSVLHRRTLFTIIALYYSTIRQNIPDKKTENRRKCREAACVKIDKAKVDFCADFEYDIGTKVWWYQW